MSLQQDLLALSAIPTFGVLDDDARRLVAFSAERQILRAGDILFRKGEPSDGGYILLSGAIAIDSHDHGGPAERVVVPQALIGETALISIVERPATAIAREPSTVLKVSRTLFHRVLQEYPESTTRLHALFAGRLSDFMSALEAHRREYYNVPAA